MGYVWAWRSNSQGRIGPNGGRVPAGLKGMPDISGIMPDGRALFIEVKLPNQKLSAEQKMWIEKAKRMNAVAIVARSIDDVTDIFK